MTVFGGFLVVLIIAAVTLIVMRVTPAYVENFNIKRVLRDVAADSKIAQLPPFQVRQALDDRLKISGIHDRKGKTITVKREGGVTRIDIEYVVEKHLVANVDLLLRFHDTATLEPR